MAHAERKKKGGQRKDKKLQRMREARDERLANAEPPKPQRDEKDIISYKTGGPSDRNQQPSAPHHRS